MALNRKAQTKAEIRRTVTTYLYRFAHGKLPRGTGYWMFEVSYTLMSAITTEQVCYYSSYAQALTNAVEAASEQTSWCKRVAFIRVMS